MGCCGDRKPLPQDGPYVDCPDGRKMFAPDAYVIAQKFGLNMCGITGTGKDGKVLRQDVNRVLGR